MGQFQRPETTGLDDFESTHHQLCGEADLQVSGCGPEADGGISPHSPLADLGFTSMNEVSCSALSQSFPLGGDWLLHLSINS